MTLKEILPEWPKIDPERPCILGLKSGIDHPLAAVILVSTPFGMIAVREYRQRLRALAAHLQALQRVVGDLKPQWACSRQELEIQIEFAQHRVSVCPVESDDLAGIQRVQSWLHAKQLFFAPTVPLLIEDMQAYRFAANELPSGEKRQQERTFHQADELPTALRIALLSWPSLPTVPEQREGRDLSKLDEKTRRDILRVAEIEQSDAKRLELPAEDANYPFGEMFGNGGIGDTDQTW